MLPFLGSIIVLELLTCFSNHILKSLTIYSRKKEWFHIINILYSKIASLQKKSICKENMSLSRSPWSLKSPYLNSFSYQQHDAKKKKPNQKVVSHIPDLSPANSCWSLITNMAVLEGGAFKRWLGHYNGLMSFSKDWVSSHKNGLVPVKEGSYKMRLPLLFCLFCMCLVPLLCSIMFWHSMRLSPEGARHCCPVLNFSA